MGVGPIERVDVVGLPTILANVFSPTVITGRLNVDLVVAPVGSFPAGLDHPREPVEVDLVGPVDHAVEMQTSTVVPFEYRDHRYTDTVSFESFPMNLCVEKVREVTIVLACSVRCDPLERRTDLDSLFQRQSHSNGVHKSGGICKFSEGLLVFFDGIMVRH